MSKKTLPVSFISIAGLFLMLSFQNCGQSFQTSGDSLISPGDNSEIDTEKNIVTENGKIYAKGRIIVKFKSGASQSGISGAMGKIAAKSSTGQANVIRHLKRRSGATASLVAVGDYSEADAVKSLKKDPAIEYAEVDYLLPPSATYFNDPGNTNSWHHSELGMNNAWDVQRGEHMVIAVADAGIANNMSDLSGQILTGWNVIDQNTNTSPENDHGTTIASVLVAKADNGIGISGLVPDAKVVPIKISNQSNGFAYVSDMAEAIYWAGDNDIPITNLSYPAAGSSLAVMEAADYYHNQKNGILVVSAGNDATDPGHFDTDDILVVAATQSSNQLADFSNFGGFVDLAAPGKDIRCMNASGATGFCSGTSFSAPITAAVAAMIWSASMELSNEEVEYLLRTTARDEGAPGRDDQFGHGVVDARTAVYTAYGLPVPPKPPNQAPTVQITTLNDGDFLFRKRYLIQADANDVDGNIQRVDFIVNGKFLKSDTSKPYKVKPNFKQWKNKTVAVRAIAYDDKGASTEHKIFVTVD